MRVVPARARSFAGAFLFASVTATATAHADGRDPIAADALFQSAREAMTRSDYATACVRFAESHRLDPAPGTLLNLAQCEEKRGRLATSLAHLTVALEALPKDDFRQAYAREQVALLRRRVPTVTVSVVRDGAAVVVTRNDAEIRDASWGVGLPVDPGPHVFVVRAEGREDVRQEIVVREGEQASVTLHVGEPKGKPRSIVGGPPSPSPTPVVRPTAASAGSGPSDPPRLPRIFAIGSFAVGGAGVITGAVTAVLFASAASTYEAHCDGTGCDPEGLAAADRGKTLGVISPIAFGVGALGAAAGTYFLFFAKRSRTGSRVVPAVNANAGGLSLTGTF